MHSEPRVFHVLWINEWILIFCEIETQSISQSSRINRVPEWQRCICVRASVRCQICINQLCDICGTKSRNGIGIQSSTISNLKTQYEMSWIWIFKSSTISNLHISNAKTWTTISPVINLYRDAKSTHVERIQTLRKLLSRCSRFEVGIGSHFFVECILFAFGSVHLNQLE